MRSLTRLAATPLLALFTTSAVFAEDGPRADAALAAAQNSSNPQGLVDGSPWAGCGPSVYSAVLDFKGGWIRQANPNGAWSYGWSSTLAGGVNLFTRAEIPPATNPGVQMWYDPSNSLGWAPSAARNPAADYDDGNLSVDAGALVLTPGDGGTYAHVVFTVPSNGLYSLAGAFYAQQHNINADVHVLIDGNVKFSQTITNLPESHSFALFLPLSAGTKVNFVVGPNGQPELHAANVGLEAIAARLMGGACAN